jgi:hypothetical protein
LRDRQSLSSNILMSAQQNQACREDDEQSGIQTPAGGARLSLPMVRLNQDLQLIASEMASNEPRSSGSGSRRMSQRRARYIILYVIL